MPEEKFSYEKTLKTLPGNDFLNLQSYLFVTSRQLTKFFFNTGITPHQVILLSMIFGVTASYLIIMPGKIYNVIGAFLLFYKNVLDKVDGSLARAKGVDSRRGRFYDSISDFIVTFTTYTAITYWLYQVYQTPVVVIAGFAAMIFSMLQCSYFIFYQVSFIKYTGKQTVNRILEDVTEEDKIKQDKWTTFLQKIFMIIYGWQDKIFYYLDKYLLKKLLRTIVTPPPAPPQRGGEPLVDAAKSTFSNREIQSFVSTPDTLSKSDSEMRNPAPAGQYTNEWYINKPFLTMASSLSIGTHIFLISISAVIGNFTYYLIVNLILMNLLLILSVVYHYISTKNQLNKE